MPTNGAPAYSAWAATNRNIPLHILYYPFLKTILVQAGTALSVRQHRNLYYLNETRANDPPAALKPNGLRGVKLKTVFINP